MMITTAAVLATMISNDDYYGSSSSNDNDDYYGSSSSNDNSFNQEDTGDEDNEDCSLIQNSPWMIWLMSMGFLINPECES
jgi:hypothetical protein